MNKSILFIPFAFIVGGIVGYWSPSQDLRLLQSRQIEVGTKVENKKTAGFNVLNTIVRIPEPDSNSASKKKSEKKHSSVKSENTETNAVVNVSTNEVENESAIVENDERADFDFRSTIDNATEIWKTRVEIARATAIENLNIPSDKVARFDVALENMNSKIKESFELFAENLAAKEKLDMELSIRMLGAVSETMAKAYDEIGEIVDPSLRSDVSELQLIDFIDPTVALPLVEVSDKL